MANTVGVPYLGSDSAVYTFAADASGGAAAGTPGGGLIQLTEGMSRYAVQLTSGSGVLGANVLPDATHVAVRAVAILNGTGGPTVTIPVDMILALYNAATATGTPFWQGPAPQPGQPLRLNYPLTVGLTWTLSAALPSGASLSLLVN